MKISPQKSVKSKCSGIKHLQKRVNEYELEKTKKKATLCRAGLGWAVGLLCGRNGFLMQSFAFGKLTLFANSK